MISKKNLQIGWIKQISDKNNNADKILIEKVIRALYLLEGLVESGLSFVFKGGTAVMLLQGIVPKRFSIDIDIIVQNEVDFEIIFNKFLTDKHFTRVEFQKRKSLSKIKKQHYKFFYTPIHKSNIEEDSILLDILIESNKYRNILSIDINSPFILQEGNPVKIKIPSVEDMIGDKMTAFAPNTTGVPYKKNENNMSMEIIKHLYDIGKLFKKIHNFPIVSETFKNIAMTELKYRNMIEDVNVVLKDIIQTSLCISTKGQSGKGDFNALQNGISRLKAYIFSAPYNIETAITHTSRVAYLAQSIKCNEKAIIYFKEPNQIYNWNIKEPMPTKLNKLKKTNPEAFFYWYQVYLLQRR